VAVDAEPGGGRFRKTAAEGERAARELEPIVAFLERDREAPRRAVIPFDIEPPRRDGEIELQARRLRGLLRERLGEIERETGEIRSYRDAQRSRFCVAMLDGRQQQR